MIVQLSALKSERALWQPAAALWRCARNMQRTIRPMRIPGWKVALRIACILYGQLGILLLAIWWTYRPSHSFWTSPELLSRMLVVVEVFAILVVFKWWQHCREQDHAWSWINDEILITLGSRYTERIPIKDIEELRYWPRRKELKLRRVGRLLPHKLAYVNAEDANEFLRPA